jgi:hypothetical protein
VGLDREEALGLGPVFGRGNRAARQEIAEILGIYEGNEVQTPLLPRNGNEALTLN